MSVRILEGDALEVLQTLPDCSVQCCVTSPPYFGLRDYGTAKWDGGDAHCAHRTPATGSTQNKGNNNREGTPFGYVCGICGARRVDGQLGLEKTPELYVGAMVGVFREVKRVLRDDGTLWLNIGSSYFQGESYPLRPIDAAWLAGIIDGEGCIQIHQQRRPPGENCVDSFQVDLGVGMMTSEVVQRCHEITGLGSCQIQNRGVWDWSCRGQQAAQLLRAIYPYLLTKKRQAALAIALANDLASRKYGRGNPAQPDVMEWRASIRKAVSDLNQRQTISMPIPEPEPITLNYKPKDLLCIPSMLAEGLRADGWYLRSDIIWHKPSTMPESITDRPTKAHEYVFLLAKSERYFYDADAIAEPLATSSISRHAQNVDEQQGSVRVPGKTNGAMKAVARNPSKGANVGNRLDGGIAKTGNAQTSAGLHRNGGNAQRPDATTRNARTVWTISPKPFREAHFATFPPALAEKCILAGSAKQACEKCGAPWERCVEKGASYWAANKDEDWEGKQFGDGAGRNDEHKANGRLRAAHKAANPDRHLGFKPTCDCENQGTGKSLVLDPFGGAGTTGLVADRLGRDALLIELNPKYAEMARRRIHSDNPLFGDVA